jgi:hypothetical protein
VTPKLREAHLRLSSTLPSRRHEWTPVRGIWGIKRTQEQNDELRAKLLEARAQGRTREQMKATFNISQHTIDKLIGKNKK